MAGERFHVQYCIVVQLTSQVNKADFPKLATGSPWPDEICSTPVTTTLATAPSWFPARYNPFLLPAEGPQARPIQPRLIFSFERTVTPRGVPTVLLQQVDDQVNV